MGAASAGRDGQAMPFNRREKLTLSEAVSDVGGFPMEKIGVKRSFNLIQKTKSKNRRRLLLLLLLLLLRLRLRQLQTVATLARRMTVKTENGKKNVKVLILTIGSGLLRELLKD